MDFLKTPVFDGLPISFVPWQVLYVMALFCVLVFVLNRTLLKPIRTCLLYTSDAADE